MPASSPSIAAPARAVGRIRVDSGDPLHDVQIPEPGLEAEVRSLLQILDAGGIERELVGREVAEPDMARIEVGEQRRKPFEVRRFRVGDDVEVLRRADHPMGVDREAADDDVLHAGRMKSPEQRLRVQDIRHVLRWCSNASANRRANSVCAIVSSRFRVTPRAASRRTRARWACSSRSASSRVQVRGLGSSAIECIVRCEKSVAEIVLTTLNNASR
jgi:hypothetical protein